MSVWIIHQAALCCCIGLLKPVSSPSPHHRLTRSLGYLDVQQQNPGKFMLPTAWTECSFRNQIYAVLMERIPCVAKLFSLSLINSKQMLREIHYCNQILFHYVIFVLMRFHCVPRRESMSWASEPRSYDKNKSLFMDFGEVAVMFRRSINYWNVDSGIN